ncbi:PGPGW domain-containing protein [Actinomadura sp. 21ATH]|uniref:PGPGW domain-containing protein n=1 Tax=Actinomadura sp. 21ATH TaxID=1735444 RepID=UPI0035BFAC11
MTAVAPDRPATTVTGRAELVPVPEPEKRPRSGAVRLARKIGVTIAGLALIVAGIVMLVIPGPGVVAILAGIGLLGTEFPAARRVSERLNGYLRAAWRKIRRRKDA